MELQDKFERVALKPERSKLAGVLLAVLDTFRYPQYLNIYAASLVSENPHLFSTVLWVLKTAVDTRLRHLIELRWILYPIAVSPRRYLWTVYSTYLNSEPYSIIFVQYNTLLLPLIF